MRLERKNLLSTSLIGILFIMITVPVFAEVQTVKTDQSVYLKGDEITFSGTVTDADVGLVTVVIRDPNDEFVLLTQAMINPDNTYERSITINDKFGVFGIHNATAFIQNMTAGAVTTFAFSIDDSTAIPTITNTQKIVEPIPPPPPEPTIVVEPVTSKTNMIADFVDTNKDPQSYVDRYNNEPLYRSWFERNYPGLTIHEAVGLSEPNELADLPLPTTAVDEPVITTQESLPVAIESSTVSYSGEFSQMLLALGGLGILFGAVYGIKRKVDNNSEQIVKNKKELQRRVNDNSEQISQNRFWLKSKLMSLKKGSEPINVVKERLAKGEITVDEYYRLVNALNNQ